MESFLKADNMQVVKVDLAERAYQIKISWDILTRAGEEVKKVAASPRAALISNYVVAPFLAGRLEASLAKAGISISRFIVPDGEDYKSLETTASLYRQFIEAGIDRYDLVIALGGGVIGDLAGFVASTYMRGLPLVQIPTTLLAQVDSSIGGKVAVNLPEGKNLVGCFHQPRLVLIDPSTLRTLPEREFKSGMAEVVKTAFLSGDSFLAYLENHLEEIMALKPEALSEVILRCCQFKAEVVKQDERDLTDIRAVLNYGHTIGHALEALAGYGQLLHGEAIAIGMICDALISYELGLSSREFAENQYSLISRVGLPSKLPSVGINQILEQLWRDKKKAGDKLRFVLLQGPGKPVVAEVSPEVIKKVLSHLS